MNGMVEKIDLEIQVPPSFPEKYYDALARAAAVTERLSTNTEVKLHHADIAFLTDAPDLEARHRPLEPAQRQGPELLFEARNPQVDVSQDPEGGSGARSRAAQRFRAGRRQCRRG